MKQYKTIQDWLNEHIENKAYKAFRPSAIMKVIPNITKEDIYDMCEEYRKQGKLALQYELICPNCYRTLGIYEIFSNIPDYIDCNICGEEEIESISSSVVIYRIVR